jgi:hypothetical protein
MPDTTISALPSGSAFADSVVPADRSDQSVTNKVTLGAIAALGGGPPAAHSASHATGGTDAITPASIGAVATSDSRLTNSRTPTAHAASHATGGTDAITPASIGASATGHTHVLANVTDAGTAASRNAPAAGNAAAAEVVLGSDTRLTDSRTPASHAASHRSTGADYPAPVCVSPAALSAGQNDWNPGRADVLYVTSSAAVTITGLSATGIPDGFVVLLMNANASGGAAITLAHESASSSAANRFRSPFSSNVILYADGGSATLVYHSAINRWRVL